MKNVIAGRLVFLCVLLAAGGNGCGDSATDANFPVAVRAGLYGIAVEELALKKLAIDNAPNGCFSRATVQSIYRDDEALSHLLVHYYDCESRPIKTTKLEVDVTWEVAGVTHDYIYEDLDHRNQLHNLGNAPVCPNDTIEFLSVAPLDASNSSEFDSERAYAKQVAETAVAQGHATRTLYGTEATVSAVMDVLACPNLVGFFYDGDASSQMIALSDGYLHAADITKHFGGKWGGLTHIWLACSAFNEPMLSAMKAAKSQVFAAGVADLRIGPSDKAAACAMQGALEGLEMKASFDYCTSYYDAPSDEWGWYSEGADLLGQKGP